MLFEFIALSLLSIACSNGCPLSAQVGPEKSGLVGTYFYQPSEITEDEQDPEEPVDPYEIIPFDESTAFSNAVPIMTDTDYLFVVNDRYDTDYYSVTLSAGDIVYPVCDITATFKMYKLVNSTYCQYFNRSISSTGSIPIDVSGTYYVVVQSTTLYTGDYSFELVTDSVSLEDIPYTYIKLDFGTSIYGPSLYQHDYSDAPSSASKSQRITVKNNIASTFDVSLGVALVSSYLNETNPVYISTDGYGGIYNGTTQCGSKFFDSRYFGTHLSFPGNAVCYSEPHHLGVSGFAGNGTSYFVDDEFLMSAAHMMFDGSGRFISGFTAYLERYGSTSYCDVDAVSAYFPLSFFLANLNSVHDCASDWAIIQVDVSTIPSTYTHGFLGLAYDSSTSFDGLAYGYPAVDMTGAPNGVVPFRVVVSDDQVTSYSGYFKTYMDLTPGESGGPCISVDNGNAYVRASVSGSSLDFSGNLLAPINAENFSLLSSLL